MHIYIYTCIQQDMQTSDPGLLLAFDRALTLDLCRLFRVSPEQKEETTEQHKRMHVVKKQVCCSQTNVNKTCHDIFGNRNLCWHPPLPLAPHFSLLNDSCLYYNILYYTILYYTILYYTILYYTILYYTILYYTILYYTILYYRGTRGVVSAQAPASTPKGFLDAHGVYIT